MTSSKLDANLQNIAVNINLLRRSEYDIQVSNNEDGNIAGVKDARRLVIDPDYVGNSIEFRKGKNTLLAIPVKDIEGMDAKSSLDKDSHIQIIYKDDQQNTNSITFTVKNNKHMDMIEQQINLLKDAESDPFLQKKVKSILNPELCSRCVEEEYVFEFRSTGKICQNCFDEQYGGIVLKTNKAEYHGGHEDHITGTIVDKHPPGNMYLTVNYLIFSKVDEISKRWEIAIPLRSVVLNWDRELQQRQALIQWEGIDVNNFGFGASFLEDPRKSFIMVVSYIDENGVCQQPRFLLHPKHESVIYPARLWISELYTMVIKSKVSLTERGLSQEDISSHSTNSCFICHSQSKIYDMTICDHCLLSFCTICIKNHTTEPKAKFDSKYLGGHKMHPKPTETNVFVFSDRIELENPRLRIAFNSMSNIENADEKKVSALRVVGLGLVFLPLAIVGAVWKKKHIYTVIEYTDALNEEQTLVFDFGGKLEEAQQMMYNEMLAIKQQSSSSKIKLRKDNKAVATMSTPTQVNTSDDDPFHILKIRFAKGEISKQEYEEMKKMLES